MTVDLYTKGRNRMKVFGDRVHRERLRVRWGNIHTYIHIFPASTRVIQ